MDKDLTNFRRNLQGYGDVKEKYSYSNVDDVNEIFDIIDCNIFNSFVAQKMNSYEDIIDEELNKSIEKMITFIKKTEGLSFQNGGLVLDNITKEEVIKKYITEFN